MPKIKIFLISVFLGFFFFQQNILESHCVCKCDVEIGQRLEENFYIDFWASLQRFSPWLYAPKSELLWNPHTPVTLTSTQGDYHSHSLCHDLENTIRNKVCVNTRLTISVLFSSIIGPYWLLSKNY